MKKSLRSRTDRCCRWAKYIVTVDDQVKAYIKRIMAQLNKWMTGGKISKLVIVITSKETGENVERWQFDVCSPPFFSLAFLPPFLFFIIIIFWCKLGLFLAREFSFSFATFPYDSKGLICMAWTKKKEERKGRTHGELPPKAKNLPPKRSKSSTNHPLLRRRRRPPAKNPSPHLLLLLPFPPPPTPLQTKTLLPPSSHNTSNNNNNSKKNPKAKSKKKSSRYSDKSPPQ